MKRKGRGVKGKRNPPTRLGAGRRWMNSVNLVGADTTRERQDCAWFTEAHDRSSPRGCGAVRGALGVVTREALGGRARRARPRPLDRNVIDRAHRYPRWVSVRQDTERSGILSQRGDDNRRFRLRLATKRLQT
jgi:hypothetical protein